MQQPLISIDQAQAVIAAALAKAAEVGVPVNVAVLDAGAHLKAFGRMDGAVLGSIDVSVGKARTSVLFDARSEIVWDYAKPGAPAPGLENTNGGLVPFGGGVPLRSPTGQLIGAVKAGQGDVEALLAAAEPVDAAARAAVIDALAAIAQAEAQARAARESAQP